MRLVGKEEYEIGSSQSPIALITLAKSILAASKSFSQILKKLKSRSSIKLQQEFPDLRKRYWCQYFWAIGYGCWSTGNITDEIVNEYLKHNRKPEQGMDEKFILE